jgi:hypothetical protein
LPLFIRGRTKESDLILLSYFAALAKAFMMLKKDYKQELQVWNVRECMSVICVYRNPFGTNC